MNDSIDQNETQATESPEVEQFVASICPGESEARETEADQPGESRRPDYYEDLLKLAAACPEPEPEPECTLTLPASGREACEALMEAIGARCVGRPYHPVACLLTEAPSKKTPWPPIPLQQALDSMTRPNGRVPPAYYLSTAWVRPNEKGELKNQRGQFGALTHIVLDDVGTKVDPNTLPPTYKIETSPGNFQWGYVLSSPIEDRDLASRFVSAVYESDLTDKGGAQITKFVRLPAGVHGKALEDGTRSLFPVRLVEFHPERSYPYGALLYAWDLTLDAPKGKTGKSIDPVVDWLYATNRVTKDTEDGWVSLLCPHADAHTPGGDDTAGYSPLGRGGEEYEFIRGYKCFHESCKEFKTPEFLMWVSQQGGPAAVTFDPLTVLQSRFVLIEKGQLVGDLQAKPSDETIALTDFKAFRMFTVTCDDGKDRAVGPLWQSKRETQRVHSAIYRPEDPDKRIITLGNKRAFNLYVPPQHIYTTRTPDLFRRHMEHVVPDEGEREVYYDWFAFKLQNPSLRSFSVIQVAQLHEAMREGNDEHTYGIGRGMIGHIIRQVWQAGVIDMELGDLLGQGSQGQFKDWKKNTQIIQIQEAKEERSGTAWTDGTLNYERLKVHLDPVAGRGERVAGKYGRHENVDTYYVANINTNHFDALRLPPDDRRFYVITNNTRKRTSEEYNTVHQAIVTGSESAPLFYWLMDRDVTGFKPAEPAMTPGKQLMIDASGSSADEIWETMMELIPGDVVTKTHLSAAFDAALTDGFGGEDYGPKMLAARWKGLQKLDPGDKKNGGKITLANGKQVAVRLIRRARMWQAAATEDARIEAKKNNALLTGGYAENFI